MRHGLLGLCAPLLAGVLAACGKAPEGAPPAITVFAAASLTEVLPEIARAWKADGGSDVRFSFAATSKLVPQILEGAPADALVAADEAWMERAASGGRIDAASRAAIARNELVFVVPAGGTTAPARERDLPGDLKKIALAGENVPAGRYAKQALENAGVWAAVEPRVVRAEDVRLTLRWVSSGETEGGVVYRTDARADPRVRVAFAFPAASHEPIVYPAAVVRGAAGAAPAARFLAFCRGETARGILQKHGFLPHAP
jgi:molybdate transport system substrate-binding protein